MKILCIGDVTSRGGVEHLRSNLWKFRKDNNIDFCVVNAENAAFITGASASDADTLFASGADCLTGGNHTLRNRSVYTYLDDVEGMLRPINFGDEVPGHGYALIDCNGYKMLVINAMGNVHIEPTLDSPYGYIDRALERMRGKYDFAILDIHAEATGEKVATGYIYDGRINVIFGTHTHVPTCDEIILPGGTGYISDIGMCGESGGVLGMTPESVIRTVRNKLPARFEVATGKPFANGVIFDLDTSSGKVKSIKRVTF